MWRRPVASTRRRSARALRALARFRVLCQTMNVSHVFVLATAAARDATNGPAFLAAAVEGLRTGDRTSLGRRGSAALRAGRASRAFTRRMASSATWAAAASNWSTSIATSVGEGVTMPLGGLALQDISGGSLKKAQKIIRDALERAPEHLERLQWAHVLRGRRDLACAGAASSGGDRLSAACDARLYDRPARQPRFPPSGGGGRRQNAEGHRERLRGASPAARLRRDPAGGDHTTRATEARSRSRPTACARACCIKSSMLRRNGAIR